MELSIIRSLMDKSFYDDHRGSKCPQRLFSKDARKIKEAIDTAMDSKPTLVCLHRSNVSSL